MAGTATLLDQLMRDPARHDCLTHVEQVPPRQARAVDWPQWVPTLLRGRLEQAGVTRPWIHQASAADLAWNGTPVVVATGTASGKSLAYLLPALLSGKPAVDAEADDGA